MTNSSRMHNTCWVVFHASASYPLVTAISRSQCTKRSSKDVLNEDISEDWLKFFCDWYSHKLLDVGCLDPGTQCPWITRHILKKSYVCLSGFPVASGLRHSPGKQRAKVHKQAIILSPMNEDHCPFLLTFCVCRICLNMWLALSQESDTFYYRFCQERRPVNVARIWVTQRPLDFSEPFVKMQGHCVGTQLKDQETSYIHHRHPSKMHMLLPIWCVQWRDLTYMPGLGLAGTDCCVQLTGHITAGWTWL